MTQTPFLDGPTDGYVFIITYGRSGSTLLQNVLNAIPGYCIRGENNNALFHMARAWDAVAHCEAIQGEKGPTGRSHPWFGAELLDADVLGRGLAETFVRDVLQPEPGARVSGFKEIRFHLTGAHVDSYLDFILRFFPKARFVFNTRSHDGVAKSGWWALGTIQVSNGTWAAKGTKAAKSEFSVIMRWASSSSNSTISQYTQRPQSL